MINRICVAYFSGTGTTETIVKRIANKLSKDLSVSEITIKDFTPLSERNVPLSFKEGDLVVFGVPVIAGRVPNLLLPYLSEISAKGAIGVPVVLYGNRNFDNALIELFDILKKSDMKVIAGGAFVGEHSFSTILAKGRPDSIDLEKADKFADGIVAKLKTDDLHCPDVPGDKGYNSYYMPRDRYGNHIDIRKVKPVTDMTKCTNCKICVRLCPLGSIDPDDVSKTPGICMKCCACIKKCPEHAKYFDDPGFIYHKEELEDLYKERKEARYWL